MPLRGEVTYVHAIPCPSECSVHDAGCMSVTIQLNTYS